MLYNVRLNGGKLITSVYYDAGKTPEEGDVLHLAEPSLIGGDPITTAEVPQAKRAYRVMQVTMGLATGDIDSAAPAEPTLVVELV